MKVLRIVSAIMAIAVMGFIFYCSCENADLSGDRSGRLSRIYATLFVDGFNDMTSEQQQDVIRSVDPTVRMVGHMAEFCALSFFLSVFLTAIIGTRWWQRITLGLASVEFTVLYALSDEWHQTFTPGRAAEWFDIGIDTLGAVIGAAVAFVFVGIVALLTGKNKRSPA